MALIVGSAAQASYASPLHAVQGYTVTIPAGGTGTIAVQAIALRPGSTLGTNALSIAAQPLAADGVRTALYYGIDWGYAENATYQVALAVWWMQDSVWQSADHDTAERIGTTALSSQGTPSWNPAGVSLLNLLQSGQVTVAPLSLLQSAVSASVGTGSLQVTNTTANELNVFLPYGTVFGEGSNQALVWAGTEGTQAPVATATSAPEATATTAVPVATQSTGKGGGQVPVEPTATTAPKGGPSKGTGKGIPANTPAPADTATAVPTAVPPTDTPQPAPTQAIAAAEPKNSVAEPQTPKAPVSKGSQQAPSESVAAPEAPAAPPASAPSGGKESVQAPEQGSSATTGSKSEIAGSPAGGAAAQPDGSVNGPVLPNATATRTGAAQPVSTASAPQAVSTSVAPQAVNTGVPNAQPTGQTGGPSVPDAQATREAFLSQPTPQPPTAVVQPTNVPPTAVVTNPGGSSDGAAPGSDLPPTDSQPTPESVPTPAPTPVPAPNDGNNTVDASTGAGSDASGGSSNSNSDNAAGSNGAAPTTNPTTGAGRSDLTTWLGLFAALMMLGGWVLRYKANRPVAVRAEARNEE